MGIHNTGYVIQFFQAGSAFEKQLDPHCGKRLDPVRKKMNSDPQPYITLECY